MQKELKTFKEKSHPTVLTRRWGRSLRKQSFSEGQSFPKNRVCWVEGEKHAGVAGKDFGVLVKDVGMVEGVVVL